MIQVNILRILEEKGITKSAFAKLLGIQRQNVEVWLKTNDIRKLEKIADALDVRISDLWEGPKEEISGYLEYKGTIYKVKSKTDIINFLEML